MTSSLAHSAPPASPNHPGSPWGDPAGVSVQEARPIDLVHLARQTFGEKRLETELLRMFMRQARQILVSLDPDAADRAATAPLSAADLLHTLVGSARVVGAFQVAQRAEGFERALRHRGPGEAQALTRPERTEMAAVVEAACGFITSLLGPA